MDIIKTINNKAKNISEEDINSWVVSDLLDFYKNRISFFANKAYNDHYSGKLSDVAFSAFQELAKEELKSALKTFYIRKQHWKNSRNINSYLIKTISNLAKKIKIEDNKSNKTNILVCPICFQYGRKEFLIPEDNLWRCLYCTKESERLVYEGDVFSDMYNLRTSFSLHSSSGFRCPDCNKFMPSSLVNKFKISCPFSDCDFVGSISNIEKMRHPSSLCFKNLISLNNEVKSTVTNNVIQYQDLLSDGISPDVEIHVYEQYEEEKNTLLNVIEDQIAAVERMGSSYTCCRKILMYEAFKNMIKKDPQEMISYLVHRKQTNHPLQSKIFQEYIRLMNSILPFSIKKGRKDIVIESLLDTNLALFLGESGYTAKVNDKHIIPNNTSETYIGGRKFKNYGPCFIGWLTDVIDIDNGTSLIDKVDNYGFCNIQMDDSVKEDTSVLVSHYRIPSHYEMGGMVYLQRIRRKIVDSVYFRLNGKKRIVKR